MDRDKLLKRRQELNAQREQSERLSLIDELIRLLDANGTNFHVHFECKDATDSLNQYPAHYSNLDWEKIPHSKIKHYNSNEERNSLISNAIAQHLEIGDTVFVKWSNALRPTISVTAKDAATYSGAMADEDFDMWVLHPEKGFCLEHYHDGYVAWTTAS